MFLSGSGASLVLVIIHSSLRWPRGSSGSIHGRVRPIDIPRLRRQSCDLRPSQPITKGETVLYDRFLHVDTNRLIDRFQFINSLSDCNGSPQTVSLSGDSDAGMRVRQYLIQLCEETGLSVQTDLVGNTIATWHGTEQTLPVVGTGSHIRTTRHLTMSESNLAVLGGIEAIMLLNDAGFQPRRSIAMVVFTAGGSKGLGCEGVGRLTTSAEVIPTFLNALLDDVGEQRDLVPTHSNEAKRFDETCVGIDHFYAWLELSVAADIQWDSFPVEVGVVTAIAPTTTYTFEVTGADGQSGAAAMAGRRDALCAAAKMVLAVEWVANQSASGSLVATVGQFHVDDGVSDSIPSRVRFTMDIREVDVDHRNKVVAQITDWFERIAIKRGVQVQAINVHSELSVIASVDIVAILEDACRVSGASARRMVSREYHESFYMARYAPFGMVIIPRFCGVPMRPDGLRVPEYVVKGIVVLARGLATLAN